MNTQDSKTVRHSCPPKEMASINDGACTRARIETQHSSIQASLCPCILSHDMSVNVFCDMYPCMGRSHVAILCLHESIQLFGDKYKWMPNSTSQRGCIQLRHTNTWKQKHVETKMALKEIPHALHVIKNHGYPGNKLISLVIFLLAYHSCRLLHLWPNLDVLLLSSLFLVLPLASCTVSLSNCLGESSWSNESQHDCECNCNTQTWLHTARTGGHFQ